MKKNWYAILLLTLAAWACNDNDYELQSAPSDIFRLWTPISYTPLTYAPDSSWKTTEVIYVPFEQSDKAYKCDAIEFFRNGKMNVYDCGFCGTPPLVASLEEQRWQEENETIVFRGKPQWVGENWKSHIESISANRLRVIQERN